VSSEFGASLLERELSVTDTMSVGLSARSGGSMPECAFHKGVETGVSCVECGRYICPKDMVDTPVGYKCRECGRSRRPTLGGIKPRQYLTAAAAGLGAGAALGLVLAFVPFMSFWLSIIGGIGVAEATRRGAGGHRTWEFAVIAAVATVLGVAAAGLFGRLNLIALVLSPIAAAVYIKSNRF
jgi:hypothetical protein